MLAKSRVTSFMCDGGERRERVSWAGFGAQALHVHVDGAGLNVRLRLPDRLEQLRPRLHAVPALDQALEQLELGRGELDFLPLRRHPMRGAVEDDRSADEAAAGGDRRCGEASQNRADAQHQLLRRKRLREVIVRAKGEALYAVGLILAGRQQQHADVARLVATAQLREHLESGVPRQHEIEDDQIGPFLTGRPQRVRARPGGGDAIAVLCKVIRDERRDIGLVVYDEDAMWGGSCRLIRHEQAGR